MGYLDTLAGQAGSLGQTILFIMLLFLFISLTTFGIMILIRILKYNYEGTIFSRTKSGLEAIRVKCGLIKKKGKLEFKILKPNKRINNFERDYVIKERVPYLFGTLPIWKKKIYLWQESDNRVSQLNPRLGEFVQENDKYIFRNLEFKPRQLGSKVLEEEFDRDTEEIFDLKNWMEKHGAFIAVSGVIFLQLLMMMFMFSKFGN